MFKKGILSILIILYISLWGIAQPWVIDDFNGDGLSEAWKVTGNAFSISQDAKQLKIDYNRTTSSGAWDQFHWNANQEIDVSSFKIEFKLKTTIGFKLNVKPVYQDGSSNWLEKSISSSTELNSIEFQVQGNNTKRLTQVFFYFDGGSSTSKSGVAYMDDIMISVTIVTEALEGLITQAKKFANHISNEEYPANGISAFLSAINDAEQIVSSPSSQDEINAAINKLHKAFAEIESSYIIPGGLQEINLADSFSTKQTKVLYYNLKKLDAGKFLFGHQDATGYGVGWNNDDDRSDVKSVCGSYPALAGWGLNGIAKGNLDERAVYRAKKFYSMGAVNTFEWHMDNPLGGDFYWKNRQTDEKPVPTLLKGGANHGFYKTQLTNLANFFRMLKGGNGESIPVIFRPFHEHTGSWFWWGAEHCSIEEYQQLWQFTVEFMRDSLCLHNLIYAYSPDRFNSKEQYLERYPGDKYVDVVAFDDYGNLNNSSGRNNFINELEIVGNLAIEKNKICAISETGLEGIPNTTWFTEILMDPILANNFTKQVKYVMVWRNANSTHHYAPYPGHTSSPDFVNFYNNPATLFVDDNLPELYVLDIPTGGNKQLPEGKTNKLYPNPASSELFVNTGAGGTIAFYNLCGKMMGSEKILKNRVNVSGYPSGIYIVKVETGAGEKFMDKVIIN